MPFVIFLIVVVLAASYRLSTRYEYTRKSRRILGGTAVGCLLAAVLFNLWLFPGLNLLYTVMAVIGVFMPLYAVAALVVVEMWRKRRQVVFDENIKGLRETEERLLEETTKSQQQMILAEHKRQTLEEVHRDRLGEQRRIRSFVDQWERDEGLARIRSIKVQEWRESFTGMSADEIGAKRDELAAQLAELEGAPAGKELAQDRIDQLRAQHSVASLVALAATLDLPNAELGELEKRMDEARSNKAEAERQLDAVRFELAEWERRRSEFLAERIVVGA